MARTYEVLYMDIDEAPRVIASKNNTKASASKTLLDRLLNQTEEGDSFEVHEYANGQPVKFVRINVDEIYDFDEEDD